MLQHSALILTNLAQALPSASRLHHTNSSLRLQHKSASKQSSTVSSRRVRHANMCTPRVTVHHTLYMMMTLYKLFHGKRAVLWQPPLCHDISHTLCEVPWLGGQAIPKTSALEPHKPPSLMLQPQESKQQAHARTRQQEKGKIRLRFKAHSQNL